MTRRASLIAGAVALGTFLTTPAIAADDLIQLSCSMASFPHFTTGSIGCVDGPSNSISPSCCPPPNVNGRCADVIQCAMSHKLKITSAVTATNNSVQYIVYTLGKK